jgi:solute carrier family 30 (zinc transporter), member 5/7
VGTIAKIQSNSQKSDRRKTEGFGNSGKEHVHSFLSAESIPDVARIILRVGLPFWSQMQMGGLRTGLLLLMAIASGMATPDAKSARASASDKLSAAWRSNKLACGVLAAAFLGDVFGVSSSARMFRVFLGYLGLTTSIFAMPPPLPLGSASWESQGDSNSKSSLSATERDMNLTLLSGGLLATLTTFLCILSGIAVFSSSSIFALLTIASAAGLFHFGRIFPIRSYRKLGVAMGCSVLALSSPIVFTGTYMTTANVLLCGMSYGAVLFDTIGLPGSHHHHHHDHGSHQHDSTSAGPSRITKYLISKCRPGSITHSIMIEKDSRRIAYFGW